MPKEKKIPTSEAALKRAMQELSDNIGHIAFDFAYVWVDPLVGQKSGIEDIILKIVRDDGEDTIDETILWQDSIKTIIKKRKPLTGVTRKLKKAIR